MRSQDSDPRIDRDKRKELDRSGRRQGVESAISDIFVPAIGLIVYGIFWRDGNFFLLVYLIVIFLPSLDAGVKGSL